MDIRMTMSTFVLVATIFAKSAFAGGFSSPYQPTRAEWLELISQRAAEEVTDHWEAQVAVRTDFIDKGSILRVLMYSKNRHPRPGDPKRYEDVVRIFVEERIKKYSWAKDVTLRVEYMKAEAPRPDDAAKENHP